MQVYSRSVDGDKDQVGFSNSSIDVRCEKEVSTTSFLYDGVETGFEDGEIVGHPCVDSWLGEITDGDLDVGTLPCHCEGEGGDERGELRC